MKKTTISSGDKFRLFEQNDTDVFIEVQDIGECCFELWEVEDGQVSSRAKIKIPKKVWAKMMSDWTSYQTKDQSESE